MSTFAQRLHIDHDQTSCQVPVSRMALSPGVLAALERVQYSLRRVLPTLPCLSSSSGLQGLAERLAADGLLVTLRSGLGVGIESLDYLSTLRHSFLICQEGSSGLCVIVDPFFREQFKVAAMPPTSAYCNVVSNVPDCFVGTIGTVNALVCLLTGTLFQEASALGLELPPWRTKQALLSNWLPRRFADAVFAPPSFSSLHPALRSSVHCTTAASSASTTLLTSPTSIQSWPSLPHAHGNVGNVATLRDSTSPTSSSGCACGSAATTTTASSVDDRASIRSLTEPRTVIAGFAAPASPPCAAAAKQHQQQQQHHLGDCATAIATAADPFPGRLCPGRSALTAQLVSAASLSRAVQEEAEAHWQRCFLSLRPPAATLTSNSHGTSPAVAVQQRPAAPIAAAAGGGGGLTAAAIAAACPPPAAASQVRCSGRRNSKDSSSSPLGVHPVAIAAATIGGEIPISGVVQSPVVSPASPRVTGGPGGSSLKNGSAGNGFKLCASTLQMPPRAFTVRLATAGAC